MNRQKLSKIPSASNHTIQKNLLKQEQELKDRAIEASELLLRKAGVTEQSAGIRSLEEEKAEATRLGCFKGSLEAFTTRHSLLQKSVECFGTGTTLINLQAATTKFETRHKFDLFDGEEELPELLEKQDLLFSEDGQSEDHINSSLSEESLIMEFEARETERDMDGPKESSLEGFDLPKADLPCSPYGKLKPYDRTGIVDLDHYVIHKEEVILADPSDQQTESVISREDSLAEYRPHIQFNFGQEQSRSMRSLKIETDVFRRIRPDPHQHFPLSQSRFESPLHASHLNNKMKTTSFDCIFNCRVVRRTKSVQASVRADNNFIDRF